MRIQIYDKFLKPDECNSLINFYKSREEQAQDWYGTWPLNISDSCKDVRDKLNGKSLYFNNSLIDYVQIVKWPVGSEQPAHHDTAHDHTTLASIVYLNEDFGGGETYFTDGLVIEPRIGRAVFFDGQYYEHGVNKIRLLAGPFGNYRYSVAAWYKRQRVDYE